MKSPNGRALGVGLLALLTAAGCRSRTAGAESDWINRGSYREGDVVYGVGAGTTRADALASGLSELAKLLHTEVVSGKLSQVPGAATEAKTSSKGVFGGVVATSLTKMSADGSRQGVSVVETVEMTSGKKSMRIAVSMDSLTAADAAQSDERSSIEIKSTNMTLGDLFGELKRAGVNVEKSYRDKDGEVFLLLAYVPKKG